ncbi:murein biosynthesis integral membrane protein MurJ [Kitasatospora sp. NPDC101155]|uniref:murein biosynthesis integral membrane protein MurJ n=1 Tax=Kitasatospora sp. NPDC101155 TaxID=3364097 RepID=UPI0037FE2736
MPRTAAPPPERTPAQDEPARQGRPLVRAFGVTAVLSLVASLLGLGRDLLLARYFGASEDTDAFLVAWTVPETAAPLLIDSAMPLLMMPAFSTAIASRSSVTTADPVGDGAAEVADPVRALVAATLPKLCLLLAAVSAATAFGAPSLVALLAPGLPDPPLAVTCTRLTSLTVLAFGISGYLASGLRAHQHFTAPATVYLAYNLGIVGLTALGHDGLGVRATALGTAVGGLLMVAAVLPAFSRHCCRLTLSLGRLRSAVRRPGPAAAPGLQVMLPVVVFALSRQCQVYIERALASPLNPGTISHLNYAEKVAQMPMAMAVMISTVSLPVVALAMVKGDVEHARDRTEKDLQMVAGIALTATAFLAVCAPQLVTLLFQRGAFTATDSAACAAVMRIYSLGLLGQALMGAVARPFFAARPVARCPSGGRSRLAGADRSGWFPALAMGAGLAVTVAIGVLTAPEFGASGLAAGNAAGITLTAALLLGRLRSRGIPVRLPALLSVLGRLTAAAVCAAGAAALAVATAGSDPLVAVLIGGAVTALAFAGSAWLLGVPVLRHALLSRVGNSAREDR